MHGRKEHEMDQRGLIIAVTGKRRAGKGTAIKHLVERYGVTVFLSVTPVIALLDVLRAKKNRDNIHRVFRLFSCILLGQWWIVWLHYRKIKQCQAPVIVFDSVRRREHFRALRRIAKRTGRRVVLLGITADDRKRFERSRADPNLKDGLFATLEEFLTDEEDAGFESDTDALIAWYGQFVYENNRSEEELHSQVDKMMADLLEG